MTDQRSAASDHIVGIVDEFGTIWQGEPGASERIGDLVQRADEETFEVRLSNRVQVGDLWHERSCARLSGGESCSCGAVAGAVRRDAKP